MKATGIVRRIDDMGRVVIPKELRRTLGIAEGDPLEFYTDGGDVVLRKYQRGCAVCGEMDGLVAVGNTPLCRKCVEAAVRELAVVVAVA